MALNDPTPASIKREPRAVLTLAGQTVARWNTLEVVNNPGHYSSDMFTIDLPIFGQAQGFGMPYWMGATNVEAVISIGLAGQNGEISSPTPLIVGLVDTVDINIEQGRCLLVGRDYSGALIETRINEVEYINLTSSQAAYQILKNHPQLIPQITDTSRQIGIYYNDINTRIALAQNATEWDFLTELANREGYKVYVQGRTLVFGPYIAPDRLNPYILNAGMTTGAPPVNANFKRLKLSRALTVARDIIVKVHSADPVSGRVVVGTFKSVAPLHANRAGAKAGPQLYDINKPGLTADQAQQTAEALAYQISGKERILECDVPGDPVFVSNPAIMLTGTGTLANQVYFLDRAVHKIEFDGGYTTTIRAKNTSQGTQFTATP